MGFLNFFKRKRSKLLGASATLYPNKIHITTIDTVKEGFGIYSFNVTELPIDVNDELLGSIVRYHLNLAKNNLKIPENYEKHYSDFLKVVGFKNAKEHYKDALYLTISQINDIITINATINGGPTGKQRGFSGLGNEMYVDSKNDDNKIGETIRFGWAKCECNYR